MSVIYHLSFNEGKGHQTKEEIRGNLLNIEYVFNNAVYKESVSPNWVRSATSGYMLDFDGYSTYIKDKSLELSGSFTISVLLAPRCFEACHGDVATSIIDHLDKQNKKGFSLSLFRHGEVQFELGDGKVIYLFRTDSQIELYKKYLITCTYDEKTRKLSLYINAELQLEAEVKNWEGSLLPISIGLNQTPFHISDIFIGGMFSGLIDFIRIENEAIQEKGIREEYEGINNEMELDFKDIDLDEAKLIDDIHRPRYHAIPAQHWMNEPHAPFYYNGKYHLFYQKNAAGPYFSNLHWGHWTSDDLVFWKNEKTALFPQKGDLTPSGVWSGSAVIGPNETPHLFFTTANFQKERNQGVGIAVPKDKQDPLLVEWDMLPSEAITQTNQQGIPSQFRDPFVWKDDQEEVWYLIIGGGIEDQGPCTWMYTSEDCKTWIFRGKFFSVDKVMYPMLGTNFELPVFLPVHDNQGHKKYVFICMSFFCSEPREQVDTYYYLGDFDKNSLTFIPDSKKPQLLDYGRFKFSGPSGFVDPVTNKSIIFSILQGDRNEQEEFDAGWAHNAGLPIELYLENNELRVKPLENLFVLRDELIINETDCLIDDLNQKLENVYHKMLEIIIEFEQTEKIVGLEMKKHPINLEKTILLYDAKKKKVWLDRTKSRMDKSGDIQGGELDIDEGLKAHIFIDHSTIECYLNHKRMITSRAYPSNPNSDFLTLVGDEDILVKSLQIYTLKPIWKNRRNE
jgi:beta-fructofuranosidase